ncbi:MAG: Ig-like domain-containing protein [Bacteroidota bacterium]
MNTKYILLPAIVVIFFVLNSCDLEEVDIPEEPVVRIVHPVHSSQILDTTVIVVEASDDRGIIGVVLYIDGVKAAKGDLLYEPYEYTWVTSGYPDSSVHELFARAYDVDSNSTVSQKVSVITNRFAPTQLFAEIVGDTLVKLKWNDVSSQETAYQILQNINDTSYSVIQTLPPNTNSTEVPGVYYTGSRYTFEVRALIGEKKSSHSNKQSVTATLSAPADLRIHSVTESQIEFRWTLNFRNQYEQYFELEQKTDNGAYGVIATFPKADTAGIVSGNFKVGSRYQFRIRAFSKYNVSLYSNVTTTFIPFPQPTSLTASQGVPSGIRLQWKDNSTFEKGFAIERKIYNSSTYQEIHRTTADVVEWVDASADTISTYTYRVRAFTELNASLYSPPVSVTFYPDYTLHAEFTTHTEMVRALTFLPNSATLISGSADGTIRTWDIDTKTQVRSVDALSSGVYSIAVSSDGGTIATGGGDNTIKLWNSATGALLQTWTGHQDIVTSVEFNQSGTTILSASLDSTVKIWNVSNGTLSKNLLGHTNSVNVARFHPNGLFVASGGNDKTVRYWDIANGTEVWKYTDAVMPFSTVAFNKDGSNLACGKLGTISNPLTILSTSSGMDAVNYPWYGLSIYAIQYSPDGTSFVSGFGDTSVRVMYLLSSNFFSELSGHKDKVTSVSYNPNNTYLASGGIDGKIIVWKLKNSWKQISL